MILLELFFSFFKVGIFSFGGGMSMMQLIEEEVVSNSYMSREMLYNFIAIAESTPGPIAINIATAIGYNEAGILGALVSTLGVTLPPFIIIILIAKVYGKFIKNTYIEQTISGMSQVIYGLLLSFSVIMLINVIFPTLNPFSIDVKSIIFVAILFALYFSFKFLAKKDLPPIALIILSALLGIIFFN